jgi:TolB-like protein/Flp pilus assembly protein TadD
MSFFHELKRRNVFRVAIAYIIVAWLVMQIVDVVLNNITAPDWIFQVLMLFLAVGLPFALLFAWAFEMTPEGLKREHEVDRSQSITSDTGRRLDYMIIGVLVIAVGMLLVDKFMLSESLDTHEIVADEVPAPTEIAPSIAVLPFANMSADESSAYFSDGLADTVLHMLAQVRELRVAARTSSFQFRDQNLDVAKIGEQLNVSTILEGSVQRSGDKIRVTAQLIDVSNGYHLWSGTFDRNLDDVFAIQDEIANEVVKALKISLLGESVERLASDQTDNIAAYTEFLLGFDNLEPATSDSLASAVTHFQAAIRLDPEYARAYSSLGRAYLALENYGLMRTNQAAAAARNVAARALDFSADSSEALAVLGLAELRDGNLETAGQLLSKAVENGPNDAVALNFYARYLAQDARPDEAIATYREQLRLDPLSENAHLGLIIVLNLQQKYSEASETIENLKNIDPDSPNAHFFDAITAGRQGGLAFAVAKIKDTAYLDPDDPEAPGFLGYYYLALEMPDEARRWFDLAIELDSEHPVSRTAPLMLNYYLRQNDDENFRLARELLRNRIDDRRVARLIALTVLTDHAAKTGRHDAALEVLDNLFPHLFDDPPHDLDKDFQATYFAAVALINSGDVDRGSQLMQSLLNLQERYDDAYFVPPWSVAGRLLLGNYDGALDRLESFAQTKYSREWNSMILERSPVFDPIREEPAFIALLDEYRENAAEQRKILHAMNEDAS